MHAILTEAGPVLTSLPEVVMSDVLSKHAADVFEAARTRRSIRAYKPDVIPAQTLRDIVELGKHAPSGSNIQPWQVHVLTGATLKRVGGAIQQAFLTDEPGHLRDYNYYTDPIEEPYLARRRACGWGLYGTLGIGRGDHEKSKAYRASNYVFFGAPAGLVLTIDRTLEVGSWFDYGLFAQTLMLAARARGLHTCAEASIASYPDIVRRELGIPRDFTVMCGIAMGYAQDDAVVNTFQPQRIALKDYATFYD
jgi:nitroreductase